MIFCDEPGIVRIMYLIKTILNITKYALPIILILMVTLDIYKNIINGVNDNKETIIKKSGNRILACIIVFCIPTAINLIFSFISKVSVDTTSYMSEFATCYAEANLTLVEELQNAKKLKLDEESEAKRKEEATLLANYEAQIKAMQEQALINQKNEQNSSSSSGESYTSNLTDLNLQNLVYVKNGVFYIPKYDINDQKTWSGRGCPPEGTGLEHGYNNKYAYNNHFWDMLTKFFEAAEQAGYKITPKTTGCRSYQTQVNYYKTMESGRAARPGRSLHGWGIASDLDFYKSNGSRCSAPRSYSNCPAMKWAHENASRFGLNFSMLNASYKEDWHVQVANYERYDL